MFAFYFISKYFINKTQQYDFKKRQQSDERKKQYYKREYIIVLVNIVIYTAKYSFKLYC